MTTTIVKKSGISFLGMLAIVFIAFKLGGVVSWSWWLVLAPLWGPWALFFLFVAIGLFVAVVVAS